MNNKLILSVILVLSLLLAGCTAQKSESINFYYRAAQLNFGPEDSIVKPETRKEYFNHLAYNEIISCYLEGPTSTNLHTPFPEGTSLVSISTEQETASIVLSNPFSQLTGIDLTIACSCLSLTIGEITGCSKVQISAQNALLDNKQSITININELSFTDLVA